MEQKECACGKIIQGYSKEHLQQLLDTHLKSKAHKKGLILKKEMQK